MHKITNAPVGGEFFHKFTNVPGWIKFLGNYLRPYVSVMSFIYSKYNFGYITKQGILWAFYILREEAGDRSC